MEIEEKFIISELQNSGILLELSQYDDIKNLRFDKYEDAQKHLIEELELEGIFQIQKIFIKTYKPRK